MATDYVITEGFTITTTGGKLVALQVASLEWAERIVTALKLLDAHEHDHRIESYIQELKNKLDSPTGKGEGPSGLAGQ